MYDISGDYGAAEVAFAKKYEQLLKTLHTLEFSRNLNNKALTMLSSEYCKHPKLSSIGNILSVREEGISCVVDQFLSITTLPMLPVDTLQEVKKSRSPLLQCIEPEQIALVTIFDLICSANTQRHDSLELLGVYIYNLNVLCID